MTTLAQSSQIPTTPEFSLSDEMYESPSYTFTPSEFGPNYKYTIDKYNRIIQNGTHYKTYFELKHIPVALANALRRTFSSLCPTVAFDDSYDSKSIVVKENTSSLHNEFVTHRISLIPINMTDNHSLAFNSKFSSKLNKRTFTFSDEQMVPIFSLNVKNSNETSNLRDQFGIINVTTNDFQIKLGEDTIYETQHFFKPDVFTGAPILINKLKSNISNEQDGEEMIIDCFPRIGLGKQNARHDPTGTVTYEFQVDTEEEVQKVFEHKIEQLQQERLSKKLNTLSDSEIKKLNNSFNLLDKQRVYTRDSNGDPNHFKYSIESIGFLNPDQIVIDSVTNLMLNLVDLRNSVIFNNDKEPMNFESSSKIELNNLTSKIGEGLSIKIYDENHTIGNLVQHYLRKEYLADTKSPDNMLSIASYRMPHPTIEEIEFIMVPSKHIDKNKMILEIESIINKINSHSDKESVKTNDLGDLDSLKLTHLLLTCLFVDSLNIAISDLSDFIRIYKIKTGITETTYSVEDSESYVNNTNNTRIDHKLGDSDEPRSPPGPPM